MTVSSNRDAESPKGFPSFETRTRTHGRSYNELTADSFLSRAESHDGRNVVRVLDIDTSLSSRSVVLVVAPNGIFNARSTTYDLTDNLEPLQPTNPIFAMTFTNRSVQRSRKFRVDFSPG